MIFGIRILIDFCVDIFADCDVDFVLKTCFIKDDDDDDSIH